MKHQLICNILLILSSLMWTVAAAGTYSSKVLLAKKDGFEEEWIVLMKEEGSLSVNDAAEVASTFQNSKNVQIKKVYSQPFNGFTAKMSVNEALKLAEDPRVAIVEQAQKMHISNHEEEETQQWGLDRIDSKDLKLDHMYKPSYKNGGNGVKVYVVDTGIEITHSVFGGRASYGINTVKDGIPTDCNGHGTHVAGTVGGESVGVATSVELVAVKVLNCAGESTSSSLIDGFEWIMKNAEKPAVINMSLGGGFNTAMNEAVKNMVDLGLTVVVAAGNENQNACDTSPASESTAITVASSDPFDYRSDFSNWGGCVDIFAPGSEIWSSYIGYYTFLPQSGTSMACPHVAGAAALILSEKPETTPAEIASELISKASDGRISDAKGSPNKLLFVGEEAPSPPTAAPTPCVGATIEISIKTDWYPEQISWELVNECTGDVQLASPNLTFLFFNYVHDECIPDAKYRFKISDTNGDGGIGCYPFCDYTETYSVTFKGVEVASGTFFVSNEASFGSCKASTNAPTNAPMDDDTLNKASSSRSTFVIASTILLAITLFF